MKFVNLQQKLYDLTFGEPSPKDFSWRNGISRSVLIRFIVLPLWVCFFFGNPTMGQANRLETNCFSKLTKGFIPDGQDHRLQAGSSKFSQLHLVFYPQFVYKIIVCAQNESETINFKITNEKGTEIFNNQTANYVKEWEFSFDSMMKAVLHVKIVSKESKDQAIKVIIGYKAEEKKSTTTGNE